MTARCINLHFTLLTYFSSSSISSSSSSSNCYNMLVYVWCKDADKPPADNDGHSVGSWIASLHRQRQVVYILSYLTAKRHVNTLGGGCDLLLKQFLISGFVELI